MGGSGVDIFLDVLPQDEQQGPGRKLKEGEVKVRGSGTREENDHGKGLKCNYLEFSS